MIFGFPRNEAMIPITNPLHLFVYLLLVIIKYIVLVLWYLACIVFEPIMPTTVITVAIYISNQRQLIVGLIVLVFTIKYYSNKVVREINTSRMTIRFNVERFWAVALSKSKTPKKSTQIVKKNITFDEKVDFIECSESWKTLMIHSRLLNANENSRQSRDRLLEGKRRNKLARMRSPDLQAFLENKCK